MYILLFLCVCDKIMYKDLQGVFQPYPIRFFFSFMFCGIDDACWSRILRSGMADPASDMRVHHRLGRYHIWSVVDDESLMA